MLPPVADAAAAPVIRTGNALDDRTAIDLVTRAVSCPSPSGHEAAVTQILVEAMSAGGAEAHVDESGNAVGAWGTGPLKVAFLGHMDTVPGEIPVRVEGGVLYGRGSVDAKGSLCAAIAAASRLHGRALAALTLHVIGAVEEEVPSSRGCRHLLATLPAPDLVIIGEPSGWDRYTLGYKGRLAVRLDARRESAHGARDEPSAAEMLVDAYAAVRRWVERDNQGVESAFDRLQVTLRRLSSEDDGLVDRCHGEVVFRLPPRWESARLARSVSELTFGPGIELTQTSAEEPVRADNRSPLARAFRAGIRAAGGAARPVLKTGTSDMNVVAPHWRVPTVAYGPGDASLDHTPHERLSLDEYLRSIEVLGSVLGSLASAVSG